MKPTIEQIQAATHEQLRVWVAEELGYVWWKRGEGSYIGLLEEDTATPDYWVKVPGAEFPLDELDGDLPNWPGDIGQAWELWRRLAHTGEWSFEFFNDGDGWCSAKFYGPGERSWLFRNGDKYFAEGDGGDDEAATICKAWLMTRQSEAT